MSQWRPMATAPKDKVILVTETPNGEVYNVMPAFWGTPEGFTEPDWWGTSFSLIGRGPLFDTPGLHAKLFAITPLCWRPVPTRASEPILKRMQKDENL